MRKGIDDFRFLFWIPYQNLHGNGVFRSLFCRLLPNLHGNGIFRFLFCLLLPNLHGNGVIAFSLISHHQSYPCIPHLNKENGTSSWENPLQDECAEVSGEFGLRKSAWQPFPINMVLPSKLMRAIRFYH